VPTVLNLSVKFDANIYFTTLPIWLRNAYSHPRKLAHLNHPSSDINVKACGCDSLYL